MSERYFQNVMQQARDRHPGIHYLSVTAEFKNDTSVVFDVHLSIIDPSKPSEFYPGTYDMVHVMNSTRSLSATIDEAVRWVEFDNDLLQLDNGLDIPMLEIHDDVPPMIDNDVIEALESGSDIINPCSEVGADDMINEGGPA